MRNFRTIVGLSLFVFFSSCSHNPLDIDVSKVKMEPVKIRRFEQDLFGKPVNPDALSASYGDFFKGFAELRLCTGGLNEPGCVTEIRNFVQDTIMRATYLSSQKEYPSMEAFEKSLNNAFRHFLYYFPSHSLPAVNTMMSGFNYSILRLDKTIGIGLEMYLGANSRYYSLLQYPVYKKVNMSREHMLPDFVKGWMMTEFEEKSPRLDFLTHIIDEGKIAYLVDAMLPEMHDSLKIGFTKKQLDWCKANEAHIWSFFIKRKILYSTDYQEIAQYTNEGPFTTGFSKESPARTGTWIGWQIVRAYMSKHKEISLQQLMEEHDSQRILAASAYKPKL
jgi:hypothetical protein